jgi:glucose dehydrogenase
VPSFRILRGARRLALAAVLASPILPLLGWAAATGDLDWPVYGGDPGASRYTPLDQINRGNVHRLRVAWVYHTGDARLPDRSQIQANPIVVDGVLYATSPGLKAFALRAATGEEIWSFDPAATGRGRTSSGIPCSRSTRRLASGSGTSRRCTTISGIVTSPRRPTC